MKSVNAAMPLTNDDLKISTGATFTTRPVFYATAITYTELKQTVHTAAS